MNRTQCEQIVDYINKHGSITSRDAMLELGVMRLASRIHDLKKQGYAIVSRTVSKHGKSWSEYSFESEGRNE